MSIERKCENCEFFEQNIMEEKLGWCSNKQSDVLREETFNDWCFAAKEKLVRQDERNKIITLLKSDLENFDGLADDCVERKDIHELLENNAVRKYIEETIKLLETEQ